MGGEQDMRKMGGLGKYVPVTKWTMLIGCIAIAGIPPFSGFFSKDEILSAAYGKNPVYYVIGVFTALLTAFYMFRLYATTFMGGFRGTQDQQHHLHESPPAMTIPLIIWRCWRLSGVSWGFRRPSRPMRIGWGISWGRCLAVGVRLRRSAPERSGV
jgi:NADH-quinone oxidoreductase subunit L